MDKFRRFGLAIPISNKRFVGAHPLATLSTNHLKRVEDALKLLVGR